MQKRWSAAGKTAVRTVNRRLIWLHKYKKPLIAVALIITIASASSVGYLAATRDPAGAAAEMVRTEANSGDVSGLQSLNEALNRDEQLCETIEKINLQEELDQEKAKAEELNDALESKDNEMNQLEDTILNALMSNLNTQMISRSSGSVSSYAEEARNLISLQNKLANFKQMPEAQEIDLTEYEATISNKLDYLPTKKPSSGSLRGYGSRRHPVYGHYHFHPAVDMSSPTGTPIYAAGAGTVTTATYGGSQGKYIVINHGNGFTTVYMHCSNMNVSAGQKVQKGEMIGRVGSTGTATGPHLHFEIRLYGEPLNPTIMIMQ
ncbi:MAG: peptidoglycan DD-metalloendopeptidase family protein [Clostridiaceae bacterium]|nr:peptidoglycan DD-metalloendopeptidase family protein [Clostridiaceae bacterium]